MVKLNHNRTALRVLSVFIIAVMCFALTVGASAGNLTEKTAVNENTAAIASLARSQIGSNQFRVWYKDELPEGGDWSAVLVTSCLSGSEVWKTDYYSANSYELYEKMNEAGIVQTAEEYEPYPGDIAFFYDNGGLRSGIVAGMYSDGTVSIVSADEDGGSLAVMMNCETGVKGYAAVPDEWFGADVGSGEEGNGDSSTEGSDAQPPVSPDDGSSPSVKPETDPAVSPDPSDAPSVSPTAAPSDAPSGDVEIKPGSLFSDVNTVRYIVGGAVIVIAAIVFGVVHKKKKVKKAYSSLFDDIK